MSGELRSAVAAPACLPGLGRWGQVRQMRVKLDFCGTCPGLLGVASTSGQNESGLSPKSVTAAGRGGGGLQLVSSGVCAGKSKGVKGVPGQLGLYGHILRFYR